VTRTWLWGAIIFWGFLIYGLVTQRMPTGGMSSFSKAAQPDWYWIQGALWAGFGIFFFVIAALLNH
jgi:hypothetical protein